jgi:hypothetical protein
MKAQMVAVEEEGEVVLYVEVDGKRIAKRYSGQGWISLEPGYTVRGSEPGGDYNTVTIEYNPNTAALAHADIQELVGRRIERLAGGSLVSA